MRPAPPRRCSRTSSALPALIAATAFTIAGSPATSHAAWGDARERDRGVAGAGLESGPLGVTSLEHAPEAEASPLASGEVHLAKGKAAKGTKSAKTAKSGAKKSRGDKAGRKKRVAEPEPETSEVTPGVAGWSRAPTPDEPTQSVLVRARNLYVALEYDRVIPLAAAVLARPDITLEQRLDAHLLEGTSLAIVGDPIEAEKAFRLLFRARPEFQMPDDTPPKIMAVFRKVQVEEQETQRLLEAALRRQIVASLELKGELAGDLVGGFPLVFRYRLKDPNAAVEGMTVQYRRQGASDYSALALARLEDGEWVGFIPGEWTSDEGGFTFEYWVLTKDAAGPLLTLGSADAPLSATIAAGTVALATPPPLPLWSFVAASGVTATLAAASGGLSLGVYLTQLEYDQLTARAREEPVPGQQVLGLEAQGQRFEAAQWIGFGLTGVALGGLAVMAPYVNWSNRQPVQTQPWTTKTLDAE